MHLWVNSSKVYLVPSTYIKYIFKVPTSNTYLKKHQPTLFFGIELNTYSLSLNASILHLSQFI